jgi:hypothetical protein
LTSGHAPGSSEVLRALEFESGFTHMEWFLAPGGEAVFGEIGARAPGARLVHAMNYTCDADYFAGVFRRAERSTSTLRPTWHQAQFLSSNRMPR